MTKRINDLVYNKERFRFEFQGPEYFRRMNGNAIEQSRQRFTYDLINQFTDCEKASLESSRCKGNKDFFGFVGRLLMTDLQLLNLLSLLNDQQDITIPLDLLDMYMDVPNSVHFKILDELARNLYIKITDISDGNMTIHMMRMVFEHENPKMDLLMVPGNPRINAFINHKEVPPVEPAVESKSLF